jgi:glutamate dehydrogenase
MSTNVGGAEDKKRSSIVSEKVKAVSDRLNLSRGSTRSTATQIDQLNGEFLASHLFAKAPNEFLENQTLDELVEISERSLACLQDYINSSALSIKTYRREHRGEQITCLNIALGDRPFIINTVTECLRAHGVGIRALLHPIIMTSGYRASLSYLELPALADETVQTLTFELRHALEQVVLVTEDFTPMLVRAETCARVLDNSRYSSSFPISERKEIADFLRWLTDGGFIFLGHAEWKVSDKEAIANLPEATLGLFRSSAADLSSIDAELLEDAHRLVEGNRLITITRLRSESVVHRRIRFTHIAVRELSPEGRLLSIHSFIGMLTSRGVSQEASSIPLIRRKLQTIIEHEAVLEGSYDYKNVVNVIDSMPKDEALRMDVETLRDVVHVIIGDISRDETRVHLFLDPEQRGVSMLTVIPRDRFNTAVRHKIQRHVEELLGAAPGTSEFHVGVSNKPLVRLYFYIPIAPGFIPNVDRTELRANIVELSQTWRDNLGTLVRSSNLFSDRERIWSEYAEAFPEDYQAIQSATETLHDIAAIERLNAEHPVHVSMIPAAPGESAIALMVYHRTSEISLSKALPVLEFAGFEVLNERTTEVTPRDGTTSFVHRFSVKPASGNPVSERRFHDVVAPGLALVLAGKADNDPLNALMLEAGLSTRALALLRTYCRLLWQVSKTGTRRGMRRSLASVPELAVQLWEMFELRFNPALKLSIEQRSAQFTATANAFKDGLRSVSDISKDKILRSLLMLLEHTLRTNFYAGKPTIALKLDSSKIDVMPQPRPLFEIFVSSPTVEGVHLRGSRVARGGLRWSERPDDFRSEVLGLVKTQKVKNVVIVPGGAKGGFIVKKMPSDPKLVPQAVEDAYKEFVRSLLTLTDNRVGEAIVPPTDMVIYDSPDPYLVVAADKGTAKFSDVANKLAVEEFNFWLGDAFASGGSNGYDHKLYAITAKGAWECVKRHFSDMGLDYATTPFTVVGIGDMSGDVFGNGMLLSNNMKVVAAFDHRHIFIDPDPDAALSFTERKRMFELPRSQWTDYNAALLSKGGGIYGRFDKEIKLSTEARQVLGIGSEQPTMMNGEQIINLVLKAPVDLIWNGGIGTYFKSPIESHSDVGDGTNDRVRINSDELRAKVIGEGGNLGFTQKARIDFAMAGGRINTDAIDNSGGVDMSDHEVNLKILCTDLMQQNKLTLEERNKLLKEMSGDVTELVLDHNRRHGVLLTLGVNRSLRNIDYFRVLMRDMARLGYVNRALESLPDDDDLNDRVREKKGLTRPELAICVATVKMWVKDLILNSPLPNDPVMQPYLLGYFPRAMRERFAADIPNHALAANIIATEVSNLLVDALGTTFVHRNALSYGVPPIAVVSCALAAEAILRTQHVRQELWTIDTVATNAQFLELVRTTGRALAETTLWLLSAHGGSKSVGEMIALYEKSYRQHLDGAVVEPGLQAHGFSATTTQSLAVFPRVVRSLEMLWTAQAAGKDVALTDAVFGEVMELLSVEALVKAGRALEPQNRWEQEIVKGALNDIRRSVSSITAKLLSRNVTGSGAVLTELRRSPAYDRLSGLLDEAKQQGLPLAALAVVAKQLRTFELADEVR